MINTLTEAQARAVVELIKANPEKVAQSEPLAAALRKLEQEADYRRRRKQRREGPFRITGTIDPEDVCRCGDAFRDHDIMGTGTCQIVDCTCTLFRLHPATIAARSRVEDPPAKVSYRP